MQNSSIRVRFAPAPTGMMHLGNVRAALMNYLFAKKNNGTFLLRIEDTDQSRNYDPHATHIISDLQWLGIDHDEGPEKESSCGPYFQSQRIHIYEEKKRELADRKLIYRCFCSQEELDKKRDRQIALKLPPRYDRTCMHKSDDEIARLLENSTPFIWRFKLDHSEKITITDLARKDICFDLSNFSDFPITRQDGSFTFIFANVVDDMHMHITHIFRGEDHLSNTASQAAIMRACDYPIPAYWHMPILCNTDGKKLSKRDFGFSLQDLKNEGYLAQAITNYLGIIGGSFQKEIMSLTELVQAIDFDNINTSGQITYAVDKLQWVNKEWIKHIAIEKLITYCRPILEKADARYAQIDDIVLAQLLTVAKTEMTTLNDCVQLLSFYFTRPTLSNNDFSACLSQHYVPQVIQLVESLLHTISQETTFVDEMKKLAKENNVPIKEFFWFLRLSLIGSTKGPGIHELILMLGTQESKDRIETGLQLLKQM